MYFPLFCICRLILWTKGGPFEAHELVQLVQASSGESVHPSGRRGREKYYVSLKRQKSQVPLKDVSAKPPGLSFGGTFFLFPCRRAFFQRGLTFLFSCHPRFFFFFPFFPFGVSLSFFSFVGLLSFFPFSFFSSFGFSSFFLFFFSYCLFFFPFSFTPIKYISFLFFLMFIFLPFFHTNKIRKTLSITSSEPHTFN
jgi:hypothetical protein